MRATWCATGSTDRDTVLLSLSPLSHHIAWVASAQWLVAGCLFVTDDPPPGTTPLDWIIETGATYVHGRADARHGRARRSRRRAASSGSARSRCSTWRARRSRRRWRPAFVAQGIKPQNIYGMTENSSHQYTHPTTTPTISVTTCGRGGPGYEVRLFDPADRDRAVPPARWARSAGAAAR